MQGNLIIVIGLAILGLLSLIILQPCLLATCLPPPIVEDADHKQEITTNEPSQPQRAIPRPLVEYPNTTLNHNLPKIPSALTGKAEDVLPRPQAEFPNSTRGIRLSEPQTSPATLARPLIEHSNGAINTQLIQPSTSHSARPRPLVEHSASAAAFALKDIADTELSLTETILGPFAEHVNAGWSQQLKPPTELLESKGESSNDTE